MSRRLDKMYKQYAKMLNMSEEELRILVGQNLDMERKGLTIGQRFRLLQEEWKRKNQRNTE